MKETDTSTQLLTIKDVAAMLKVSTRQVRMLSLRGEIPKPFRIGGSIRWRKSEVEAYIAQLADLARSTQGATNNRRHERTEQDD